MPSFNSASRLLALVESAERQGSPTGIVSDVWAGVFGVQGATPLERDIAVMQRLMLAGEQLAFMREMLGGSMSDASAYEEECRQLQRALSPRLLGGAWSSVRDLLKVEIKTALRMAAGILPQDGTPLTEEELTALRKKLDEVNARIDEEPIPIDLRMFLRRQTELLELALAEYSLGGFDAIRRASDQAAANWLDDAAVVNPHLNDDLVGVVRDMWDPLMTWGKRAYTIGALMKLILFDAPQIIARLQQGDHPPPAAIAQVEMKALPSGTIGRRRPR